MTKQIIVIGAGVGGLAVAIRLAARGERVRVLEKRGQVGGKLNQVKMDGFSFDTGPSLLTMPGVVQELFCAAGRRLEEYLELVPLEVTCRYFYRDGLVLNAWREHERLAAEFARLNARDGEGLYRFLEYGRGLYEAAADPFLYHSLGRPLNVLGTLLRYVFFQSSQDGAKDGECLSPSRRLADVAVDANEDREGVLRRLGGADTAVQGREGVLRRLRAVMGALEPRTLDEVVRRFFEDEHLRQLFDRYATYNGSSPYRVGAVYSIIPYVEMAGGGWYPRRGMYKLVEALEQVARELGVRVETGCEVRRILVERGEARGVVLADGRVLRCDVVVANSDVVTTQRELLSPAVLGRGQVERLERLEPSSSGFVLLLGMNKEYPELAHHNIFFSDDYRREFEDLFVRKQPLREPTIYVCATTRTDVTQAPVGCENLFVLVNAPYVTEGSDWKRDARGYREHILDVLGRYEQVDLRDLREHIVCEEMLTPEDFKVRYGANAGSIYGLSSNQRMAPFTRPGNRARGIRGLYFVGGSTHPGGGVPLVMLSGKIVAEMVEEDIHG